MWAPEKLALQYDELRRHPDFAKVYSDMLRVPSAGTPYLLAAPELRRLFDQRSLVYVAYGIGIQTCVIRRKVLRKVSGFDETLPQFEDLDLFLRIVRKHHVRRIAKSPGSVSKQDEHNAPAR